MSSVEGPFMANDRLNRRLLYFFLPRVITVPISSSMGTILSDDVRRFHGALGARLKLIRVTNTVRVRSRENPGRLYTPIVSRVDGQENVMRAKPRLVPTVTSAIRCRHISFNVRRLHAVSRRYQ